MFTHFKTITFFSDLFCEQTFTLIPLTNSKHVMLEKTKSYKKKIFFP